MSYYKRPRWPSQPDLPPKGTRVVLRGDPKAPTMTVLRHTQFDNGEVECLWFSSAQTVQRAWFPADLLVEPRTPFADRRYRR